MWLKLHAASPIHVCFAAELGTNKCWPTNNKDRQHTASLLPPLSRTCYNRSVGIAAQRDAPLERRLQQTISLRTNHESPDGRRAIKNFACRSLCDRQNQGAAYGQVWRSGFHRF